jgi:hypothetical protein
MKLIRRLLSKKGNSEVRTQASHTKSSFSAKT